MLGKLDSNMWKNDIRTFSHITHKNINSKWIKDLNIKTGYHNTLRKTQAEHSDKNHSSIFSEPPLRVMTIKTKINKWDLIKLKSCCTAKETLYKMKRQRTEGEKILANEAIDKSSKYTKYIYIFIYTYI